MKEEEDKKSTDCANVPLRMFHCHLKKFDDTGQAVVARTHSEAKTAYSKSELFIDAWAEYIDIRCSLLKTQPKDISLYGLGVVEGQYEELIFEGVYGGMIFCPVCEEEYYSTLQDNNKISCSDCYEKESGGRSGMKEERKKGELPKGFENLSNEEKREIIRTVNQEREELGIIIPNKKRRIRNEY